MFICSINIRPLVSNFQRKLSLADNGLAVSSSSSVSKCLQTLGQNVSAQIQEDSCLPACPRCTGLAEQLGDEVGHLQPCWMKAPREVMRRTWLRFETLPPTPALPGCHSPRRPAALWHRPQTSGLHENNSPPSPWLT